MHFFVGVMVKFSPGDDDDVVKGRVYEALAPFDLYDSFTDFYRTDCPWCADQELEKAETQSGIPTNCEHCEGRGWIIGAYNRRGIWEYALVGGRYSGWLGTAEGAEPRLLMKFPSLAGRCADGNMALPSQIRPGMRIDALVTPRGGWVWLREGTADLQSPAVPTRSEQNWHRLKSILDIYGDEFIVVGVEARDESCCDPIVVKVDPETIALADQANRQW